MWWLGLAYTRIWGGLVYKAEIRRFGKGWTLVHPLQLENLGWLWIQMRRPVGFGGGSVLDLRRWVISDVLNFHNHLLWPIHLQTVQDSSDLLYNEWHLGSKWCHGWRYMGLIFFLSVPDSWLHWHLAFRLCLLCVQWRDRLPGSGGDCHLRSDGGDFLHDGVEAYLTRTWPWVWNDLPRQMCTSVLPPVATYIFFFFLTLDG